jgi:DNA-binding beta-propeller fold protein YncE
MRLVHAVTGLALLGSLSLVTLPAHAAPFTYLQPGFSQGVFAVSPSFLGGLAIAPDGDICADECAFAGSPMHRFDFQTTIVVNGTMIHPNVPGSPFPSNLGCGLCNHPSGDLYSNTGSGVVRVSAANGAPLGGPFGPAGDALGICVDPQTGDLVYVRSDGAIVRVDAALTTSSVLSAVTLGDFVDGISFDPTGNYLFLSDRSPIFRLVILNRSGALVQYVNMTSEPDGIAFNSPGSFVVTNNTDGTMTRFDFPGNNFNVPPVISLFASGGFRGDLAQVSTDGCIYLTQDHTRYDNSLVTTENSIVVICGNFTPVVTHRSTWGQLKATYR